MPGRKRTKGNKKSDNQYDPQYIDMQWQVTSILELFVTVQGNRGRRTQKKPLGQIIHVSVESKHRFSNGAACVVKLQTNLGNQVISKVGDYRPASLPPAKLKSAPSRNADMQKRFGGKFHQ